MPLLKDAVKKFSEFQAECSRANCCRADTRSRRKNISCCRRGAVFFPRRSKARIFSAECVSDLFQRNTQVFQLLSVEF